MKSFLFSLVFASIIGLNAQENIVPISKDIIYLEGGGNSMVYSINYERIFFIKNNFQLSGRLGVGIYSMPAGYYNPLTQGFVWMPPNATYAIPMEANFVFGRKRGKFELGLGYTHFVNSFPVMREDVNGMPYIETYTRYQGGVGLSCLYRYEKLDGGFFLKAGLTGVFMFGTDPNVPDFAGFPWPKLVLGYKFKRCK